MPIILGVIFSFVLSVPAFAETPSKQDAPRTTFGKRCGFLCMATVSGALGQPLNYQELARRLPDNETGSSLDELNQSALAIGLASRSVRYSGALPNLESGEACAILPIRGRIGEDHFVVLIGTSKGVASVVDFPNGMVRLTDQSLRKDFAWDGTALLIAKSNQQLDRLTRTPVRSWLWASGSGLCFTVVLVLLVFRKRAKHAM